MNLNWVHIVLYETPEGKSVGLTQSLAMDAIITVGSDSKPIIELLKDMDIIHIQDITNRNNFLRNIRIFVNGAPQGYTHNPHEIVKELRTMRRNGSIDSEISISLDLISEEIRIFTDNGRICRGVIILNEGQFLLNESILDNIEGHKSLYGECNKWINLLKNGYVEMLCKDEEEYLNVAVLPSDLEKINKNDRKNIYTL